jgi:hypothetical protein
MVNADDYLKQTHSHEHPLSDIDKFINEHLLGYQPKDQDQDAPEQGISSEED